MVKEFDRKIILEDGQEYYGYGFGANKTSVLEWSRIERFNFLVSIP